MTTATTIALAATFLLAFHVLTRRQRRQIGQLHARSTALEADVIAQDRAIAEIREWIDAVRARESLDTKDERGG